MSNHLPDHPNWPEIGRTNRQFRKAGLFDHSRFVRDEGDSDCDPAGAYAHLLWVLISRYGRADAIRRACSSDMKEVVEQIRRYEEILPQSVQEIVREQVSGLVWDILGQDE